MSVRCRESVQLALQHQRTWLMYVKQYHVVFDFLEHVIIGHDEFLGCVAVGDVGKDAQRLPDKKSVTLVQLSEHFEI